MCLCISFQTEFRRKEKRKGGREKERRRKEGKGGGEGKGRVRKGDEMRGDKRRREERKVLAPITLRVGTRHSLTLSQTGTLGSCCHVDFASSGLHHQVGSSPDSKMAAAIPSSS